MKSRQILRSQPRACIPGFKVAIARTPFLLPKTKEYCELVDVSWGGICIESDWLKASVGQKLNLELYYDETVFPVRGFVARRTARDKSRQYGITFIYAPHQLERLIEIFMAKNPQYASDHPAGVDNVQTRQKRIPFRDAQVYVKANGEETFVVCEVDNISQGGMGFVSPVKFDLQTPFGVSVQISESPDVVVVSGEVRCMGKKADKYYYGMEYDQVPEKYIRLLENLIYPEKRLGGADSCGA